jgi:hypothetical protein
MRTPSYLPETTALWRYIAAWLVASAIVVAALATALDEGRAHPQPLTVAAERASCRFVSDSDRPASASVVLSYPPTLSGRELARVRAVARRLAAPSVATAQDPRQRDAIAAENGDERLGCPRVDARAEDAIVLFVLSSDLDD